MHLAALGAEPAKRFVLVRTDQRNRPPVRKENKRTRRQRLIRLRHLLRSRHPSTRGSGFHQFHAQKHIDFFLPVFPARNPRSFANETNLR